MKKGLLTILLTSAFILGGAAVPSFASTTSEISAGNLGRTTYAVSASVGQAKSRISQLKQERINVNNAVNNNSSSTFYSVGAHNFSRFTFGNAFNNIKGEAAIDFHEVTWGNSWHEEAVEVYLINPTLKTDHDDIVKYWESDLVNATNSGIDLTAEEKKSLKDDHLYFAGVAYNKMVSDENVKKYEEYEKTRLKEISTSKKREFATNKIVRDGDTLITEFVLPAQVASAEGVVLVDVTEKVNKSFYNRILPTNDDGFDLAAISVREIEE